MSLAALNGTPVSKLRLHTPAWGRWWADVSLTEADTLTGAVSLTVADIVLTAGVISGGAVDGRASYRLVGAPGWSKRLPAKPYANDAGVTLANVLGDAARECGETIAAFPAAVLDTHFARAEGIGALLLNGLAERAWYVDYAGVTQLGRRPETEYTDNGVRTKIDPGGQIVEIATEKIATLVPGVRVDGAGPASDVEIMLDADRLTARVYTTRRTSARLQALASVLDGLDPFRKFRAPYEYRVVDQTGDRFDLQIVRVATGLPDLANVSVRPGIAGARADVQLGELVLVSFIDGDPSRPAITSHDAPDAPGWMPLFLELGEGPTFGIARMTDPVIAGGFGGTIVRASVRNKAGL